MIVRMFMSAVAPGDVEELVRLFTEDVAPAFEAHPDCLGIELIREERPGVGGLIDGGVITRWTSPEAMEAALDTPEIKTSQVRVRALLHRLPLRKTYEVLA
ncbi:MAG: antibiotic biosynthesis monooxygenase family protein [Acidimicrobiia bacterium]